MDKDSRIRDALNQVVDVFRKQPQEALSTNRATAVIEDGLTCVFTEGEYSIVMDMPEMMGGDETGPSPGFFARAGVAGCMSIRIKQAAAMASLAFDTVAVDMETDFDVGAAFGLGSATAAPLETRLTIRIGTGIPESEVSALVEKTLGLDPWFLALRDAQSVKLNVVVEG